MGKTTTIYSYFFWKYSGSQNAYVENYAEKIESILRAENILNLIFL